MLKISQVSAARRSVTLRLEGRVVGPWVGELRQSCERVLQEGRSVSLQLADVEYVDRHGAALLSDLRARGVMFLESPPFIVEQLRVAPKG